MTHNIVEDLLDAIDDGILDPRDVVLAFVKTASADVVAMVVHQNELLPNTTDE